ncbi:hypothetical protein FRZ03_19960 [Streptomyces misionensis]|uniref:Uncharacterized protein n=1 Tax=Streptomyces misionensis TaxID=67331 RepID=A0A5C6JLP3_9ACTN|nr:hypothetical protein [Streptomyces misionensis]TWV42548.1 hypothetical protein FRZ03_19960 [Streptomyces misionensis]
MRISRPQKAATGTALGTLLLTGTSVTTAQAAPATYSIAMTRTPAVKTVYASTAAAASRRLITISIMCMDVGARVDLLKNGKPVGSATVDVKHNMTLKADKLKWAESFTVGKATLVNAGGVRLNSVGGGKGVETLVKFP